MNLKMDSQGVTLIELLVAIVILGIVSGIAGTSIFGVMENMRQESVVSDALAIRDAARRTCMGGAASAVCDSQLSEYTLLHADNEDTFGRYESSDYDYIAYGGVDQDGNISNLSEELLYFQSKNGSDMKHLDPLTLEARDYEYFAINIKGSWQIAFKTEDYIYMGNPVLDDIAESNDNVEQISDDYDDLLDAFIQYLGDTNYWGSEYLGDYPHYSEIEYSYDDIEEGSRFIYDHPEYGQSLFEVTNRNELNTGSQDGSFKSPSDPGAFYSYGPYQKITDAWHEHNTYQVGDTVEYQGEEYVVYNAGEANQNEPTGFDASRTNRRTGWNVVSDRWHPHNIYEDGDVVQHGNSEFEVVNSGEANDHNPISGNGWVEIIDDSDEPGEFDYPEWQENTVYDGDLVEYDGYIYHANWWTRNDVPADNHGPEGSGEPWTRIPDWNEDADYDVGDKVVYEGQVYEANHHQQSSRNSPDSDRWDLIEP